MFRAPKANFIKASARDTYSVPEGQHYRSQARSAWDRQAGSLSYIAPWRIACGVARRAENQCRIGFQPVSY
jgi:hypothetical protein